MANISVGQDKLQVAAPQKTLARRQTLDLSGAFGTAAEVFGGVREAKQKREEEQKKLSLNQSAQEIILGSEQDYLNTRDKLIASGNWNSESAFQLKNRSRMLLRRNLVSSGVVDKDLVSHAESQLSKSFVDGEWKTEDASMYFKKVTSPNGQVSIQPKGDDEVFSSILMDVSKTNPSAARKIAHASRGGEVMDKDGKVVVFDNNTATNMLVRVAEADERLEREKESLQRRKFLTEAQKGEVELLEAGTKLVKPIYESSLLARVDILAASKYADFDPVTTNKDQLILELTRDIKNVLNSETFTSFDTSNEQGQSINNILRSEYLGKSNDIAKTYAENIYNARVTEPELIKNQRMQRELLKVSRIHGATDIVNTPFVKNLEQTILRQEKGEFSGLMVGNISDLKSTLLASVRLGEDLDSPSKLVYWKLMNAQGMTDIEEAEATLRVANPGSIDFENSLQKLFTKAQQYVEDSKNNTNMVDHGVGFVAAELALRNPKIREHLSVNRDIREVDIILKALQDMATKARNAKEQEDKITGFNQLEKLKEAIERTTSKSFESPATKEEE